MTVPAWPIQDLSTVLNLDPDDHIFENLVDRMSGVQRPVRIRWSIVENEWFV